MIDVDRLPTEIRESVRCVVWNQEEQNGELTKVPYRPRCPGVKASSTNPATWGSFDEAYTTYLGGKADGVGHVLGDVTGVDLDHCRDPQTGAITPWANDIIRLLSSYTEESPSGTGIHIFLRGSVPGPRRKKGDIEMYPDKRFFTLTGQHIAGTPRTIEERTDQIATLYHQVFGNSNGNVPQTAPPRTAAPVSEDDAALLERAKRARNGDTFSQLWAGDTSGHPSHSEADLDLCNRLAFWAGRDPGRMDALFRQSGLMRPKWDERHGGRTYGEMTIEKAIADCGETYTPMAPPRGAATEQTPKAEERTSTKDSPATEQPARAQINAGDHDLHRVTDTTWDAVLAANDPPTLFRYGSAPARLEQDDTGELVVAQVTPDRLRHHLGHTITWYITQIRKKKPVEVPALPPIHVVRDMLARPNAPLPVLTRIVHAPVFAVDGTLQQTPGYHPGTRVYYAPDSTLAIPDVPERPSDEEITKAKDLLVKHLLVDFPFVNEAEKANAIGLFLLPFVRELITGPKPLHLFEKPTAGTGATLLVDMLQYVFTGKPLQSMTEGRDEDEWRKRVTAKLLTGTSYLVIDNIQRRFDSAAVSSAITATTWEDRRLGGNEMARIPVRCAWVATANNPVLSMEIARRTVRIRLDAHVEEPWLRETFTHDNLRGWVAEHRGELIWSALVLVRTWLVDRRVYPKPRLGMFESWSGVIGGILHAVSIPQFLGNLEEFYATTDTDTGAWRTLVEVWWERFRDQEVGVSDLWQLVEPPLYASDGTRLDTEPINLNLGDGTDKSRRTKFGMRLVEVRDRQFDTHRIVQGGKRKGAQLWKLEVVG